MENMDFLPREKLNKEITKASVYDSLVEQARSLNLEDVVFDTTFADAEVLAQRPVKTKIDKQKVYFWIRVYLSEDMNNIEAGDDVMINYTSTGEELETKFICYAKMGASHIDYEDGEPVVANYNSEDNKKCLCLMVDEERINYESDDIPFLRKLFRIGRHYEYELVRRSELTLTNKRTEEQIDYYDIEF